MFCFSSIFPVKATSRCKFICIYNLMQLVHKAFCPVCHLSKEISMRDNIKYTCSAIIKVPHSCVRFENFAIWHKIPSLVLWLVHHIWFNVEMLLKRSINIYIGWCAALCYISMTYIMQILPILRALCIVYPLSYWLLGAITMHPFSNPWKHQKTFQGL